MLYIYGCGKRGKKYYEICKDNNIRIEGFIDKNPDKFLKDNVNCVSYDEFKKIPGNKSVIVSMADCDVRNEVIPQLSRDGIDIISFSDLIFQDEEDKITKNRLFVAEYHVDQMDNYYEEAESTIDVFWGKDTIFKSMFDQLDLKCVIEIACGRGRHVEQYKDIADEVILVDILEKNIGKCKERFKMCDHIKYYCNNGTDLREIKSESVTAVFSYDSMVHFEMMDIFSYLREIERVLVHGGYALIHHSNNTESYDVSFETGKSGRSFMSKDVFAYMADRANLSVVEQQVIDWEGHKNLDCVSLIKKE